MLPPAARVIAYKHAFAPGTCYCDWLNRPCGPQAGPVIFDTLGAIFWAYRSQPVENRHLAAKRVFSICKARYGHARIGQLDWEEACDLLRDADA